MSVVAKDALNNTRCINSRLTSLLRRVSFTASVRGRPGLSRVTVSDL